MHPPSPAGLGVSSGGKLAVEPGTPGSSKPSNTWCASSCSGSLTHTLMIHQPLPGQQPKYRKLHCVFLQDIWVFCRERSSQIAHPIVQAAQISKLHHRMKVLEEICQEHSFAYNADYRRQSITAESSSSLRMMQHSKVNKQSQPCPRPHGSKEQRAGHLRKLAIDLHPKGSICKPLATRHCCLQLWWCILVSAQTCFRACAQVWVVAK